MADDGITIGTVVRADFFWKNEPKADGKARNCVIIARKGRMAIIAPFTTLDHEGQANCTRISDRETAHIDRMKDDKSSYINLGEQNLVYLDGPRIHRAARPKAGQDSRIHGQLSPGLSQSLSKSAIELKVKPAKKQIDKDWKEDLLHFRGREAAAAVTGNGALQAPAREDRVRKLAEDLHARRTTEKKKVLSIGRPGQDR
ncbi:hypothetical protein ACOI1H_14900 [Loktanella sp. DJP18]|uniref:hypothetical protein n=1 Tax=Loktanella sp. DJP18 TaxID=3409788 RepID=UPI003BB70457